MQLRRMEVRHRHKGKAQSNINGSNTRYNTISLEENSRRRKETRHLATNNKEDELTKEIQNTYDRKTDTNKQSTPSNANSARTQTNHSMLSDKKIYGTTPGRKTQAAPKEEHREITDRIYKTTRNRHKPKEICRKPYGNQTTRY